MTRYGEAQRFFETAMVTETDDCILWPYACDTLGYGMLSFRRGTTKMRRVHNLACERAYGPSPPGNEACHRCNRRNCLNTRHLRWDTRKGNMADQLAHGTRRQVYPNGRLRPDEVRAIRASSEPTRDLAMRFNVSKYAVWEVRTGRTWRHI